MKMGSAERKLLTKVIFAIALLLIFSGVVSSIPENRLAWQGPLVMGTLALPKPNPAMLPPRDMRPNSDSMFSLLGFVSAVSILGLGGRWFFSKPSPKKMVEKVVLPLIFP
jgi:hypothetical protein